MKPYWVFVVGALCVGSFYLAFELPRFEVSELLIGEYSSQESVEEVGQTKSMLFVGDVMLARDVEWQLRKFGDQYVHQNMYDVYNDHEFIAANFEGAVPVTHRLTPADTFAFSINSKYVKQLALSGYTHLSLANNHSRDFNQSGYTNTKRVIKEAGMESLDALSDGLVSYVELEGATVALVAIDFTINSPAFEELAVVFESASATSDTQIAYVHWGTEYETTRSDEQRRLAEQLIAAGADMIIGHHPHVVQDIQLVSGVLVFYSLGNFIFDQKFSEDVQVGLTLSINESGVELLPVSTADSYTAPKLMSVNEKERFLSELAKRSDPRLKSVIQVGKIPLNEQLAVSP